MLNKEPDWFLISIAISEYQFCLVFARILKIVKNHFLFFYSPIFFSPHLRSTTLPFCFFKCQVRVILFFIKKKLLLRGVSYRSTDAQSNSFNFQLRSRRWRSSRIYFSINFGKKIYFFLVSFFCLFFVCFTVRSFRHTNKITLSISVSLIVT